MMRPSSRLLSSTMNMGLEATETMSLATGLIRSQASTSTHRGMSLIAQAVDAWRPDHSLG